MLTGLVFCCSYAFVAARTAVNIVGGSPADEGQFPWQLLLTESGGFICGAVLIEPDVALTAAQCLGSVPSVYQVIAGQHDRNCTPAVDDINGVISYIRHPGYDDEASGFPNDIAVMKLSRRFHTTGDLIRTIPMASNSSSDFAGSTCTITGWGSTVGGGPTSSILQFADMVCLTHSDCSSRWSGSPDGEINDDHICAFHDHISACTGDSGGPMVCEGVLAGIASWHQDSCRGELYPSVFTRISHYRDWIEEHR